MIIPVHKKGDRKECINHQGISLIFLPGKVYASALKKCLEIIESKLEDTQCGFRSGRRTTDQSFTLQQIFDKYILAVCQRCLHMFCRPQESIRPGPSL